MILRRIPRSIVVTVLVLGIAVVAMIGFVVVQESSGTLKVGGSPEGVPSGAAPEAAAPESLANAVNLFPVHGVAPEVLTGDYTTPDGVGFDLQPIDPQPLPKEVDSNSPAFWYGGEMYVFTSAFYDDPGVFRSSGPTADQLGDPEKVEMPSLDRPGNIWLESVWLDPDGTLYGWYHFEPADLECSTAAIIGAAVSYDLGLTWQDRGFVLQDPYPVNCDYDNGYMAGGVGDFSVVVDPGSNYFYFLFSNYGGPVETQGISIARSAYDDRGQPGTLETYDDGDWIASSDSTAATPLFSTSTGWEGPFIDAFWGPDVQWNTYLNSYVALINRSQGEQYVEEGVYVTFSQDLLHWSEPQKILGGGSWYGEAIGLGPGETDSYAGASMLIYNEGIAQAIMTFR